MKLPIKKNDDTNWYQSVSGAYFIVGILEIVVGLLLVILPVLQAISNGYSIYWIHTASGIIIIIVGVMIFYASYIVDQACNDVVELRDYIERMK